MTGPAPCHRDTTVTVYHGDCLDVLPALDAESVDAVITDPPYALNLTGREQGRPATTLGHLTGGDRDPAHRRLSSARPSGCGRPRRGGLRRRRPVPVPGLPLGAQGLAAEWPRVIVVERELADHPPSEDREGSARLAAGVTRMERFPSTTGA